MHPLGIRPPHRGRRSLPFVAIGLVAILIAGFAPGMGSLHAAGPAAPSPAAEQTASSAAVTHPSGHPA
ncbi:MAG TPA: hypothetical protein VN842_02125, partial [Thermoplasmata archaeon]|nr:hypothetical protein [Thermoplasmata archaeon]